MENFLDAQMANSRRAEMINTRYPTGDVWNTARMERNWLVYELKPREGKKPSKIPVDPSKGFKVPAQNADLTLKEAQKSAYQLRQLKGKEYGVGYLPRAGSAMVGVDIDGCVKTDGTIEQWAAMIITGSAYIEASVSGTGLRVLLPREIGDDWFAEIEFPDHPKKGIGWFGTEK